MHRRRVLSSGLLLSGVLVVLIPSQADDSEATRFRVVSSQDCSFNSNPDAFLAAQGRIREDLFERTRKWNVRAAAGERAAVPARDIPRRNFVDEEIFDKLANQNIPSAPLSTDEEFFRRIHLDLTGRIPAAEEIRQFVADQNPNKRNEVIDRLLYSPEFADKWTLWFGDLLQVTEGLSTSGINRRTNGRNAFYGYVRKAISEEKTVRDLAWEVVAFSGNNYAADAGMVNFIVGGNAAMGPVQDTYDMMMSKTASTFLGLGHYDCLVCHNGRGHLDQISLWGRNTTRMEAWQMAAFFSRTRLNRLGGNANLYRDYYDSTDVVDAQTGQYDLNTLSGNRPARCANNLPPDPRTNRCVATGSVQPEYRVTRAKPKNAMWRASFADFLVEDPMFARNFANRLWKQMFSLGLVEPVDTMDPARLDPASPPPAPWTLQATHPVLLEKLAQEFVNRGYNLREFLRLLVESSAYQLSSRYDGAWKVEYVPLFARHYPRRLEGEEIHDAVAKATGNLPRYTYNLVFNQTLPQGTTVIPQSDPIHWAVQLPDPNINVGGSAFMNVFIRGNRDTQLRSQSGSILQQLALMNDTFVTSRVKMNASPVLREVAKLNGNDAAIDEVFLTFLSRLPSAAEREKARVFLGRANSAAARNVALEDLAWTAVNKVEFIFSY